jgi:hypothetical protein
MRSMHRDGGEGQPDAACALVTVAARLLAAVNNPATAWTPSGRSQAERCAREMLRQAGERTP